MTSDHYHVYVREPKLTEAGSARIHITAFWPRPGRFRHRTQAYRSRAAVAAAEGLALDEVKVRRCQCSLEATISKGATIADQVNEAVERAREMALDIPGAIIAASIIVMDDGDVVAEWELDGYP